MVCLHERQQKAQKHIAAGVGTFTTGEQGSRVSSLRHGPDAIDAAMFQAFPFPAREFETLLDAMRLTTMLSGSNLLLEEEERVSGSGAQVAEGMIEGIKNFINSDNVKALTWMAEAWRKTFDDRWCECSLYHQEPCVYLGGGGGQWRAVFWKVMTLEQSRRWCTCREHTQDGSKFQSRKLSGQRGCKSTKRTSMTWIAS